MYNKHACWKDSPFLCAFISSRNFLAIGPTHVIISFGKALKRQAVENVKTSNFPNPTLSYLRSAVFPTQDRRLLLARIRLVEWNKEQL